MTAGFETIPTGEYFFLEPEAKRFVRGETDRLPINGCMLLFLIPFVLSGLLILGLSVAQWVRISYFSSSKWAHTEGTYVSKDEIAESNGSTRYAVTFRFVVDDRVYGVEENVEQGIHDRATEGAALRVYYRRDDPNIASISPVSGRGGQPLGLTCGTVLWWACRSIWYVGADLGGSAGWLAREFAATAGSDGSGRWSRLSERVSSCFKFIVELHTLTFRSACCIV